MSAPGNKPKPDSQTLLIGLGIYLTFTILVMRFMPGLAVMLLVLGLITMLAYSGWLVSKGMLGKVTKKSKDDFAGRIKLRLQDCQDKEEKFRSEAEQIRLSISTLRDDLERSSAAGEDERTRAENVIKELEAEFNLRHAKASFFADCGTKLKILMDRYQLQESISARKQELEALRSTNFDDEATLEETRYHLERDTIELDTIAELSKEAFVSFKAEQAEELRVRLEKLRSRL
ncbi:hypothetical protein [Neolewinella persica]|uniref:hypothetical protein n=1 Tax=Neolewinella persica TaxID=70998 RepID=UPI0004755CB8|nr:hypothetical protein [Neolewinella persica]